jgi:uncharacterized protein YjiS (DUF1127 family)
MLQCTNRIAAMQQSRFQYPTADHIFTSNTRTAETKITETRRDMNLIRNYRNWRRYRETVTELGRLSNRELSDLGIARGDITFVARKAI